MRMERDLWSDANMAYLTAAVGEAGRRVKALLEADGDAPVPATPLLEPTRDARPPALEALAATFGLSDFEKAFLLMAAGVELDAVFANLCAKAQGRGPGISFDLAKSIAPGAHWSALSPGAPLRRWRMVELEPGGALAATPLRIDPRTFFYLVGVPHADERLEGFLQPAAERVALPPSQAAAATRAANLLSQLDGGAWPVIQLGGRDHSAKAAVAAAAAAELGLDCRVMKAVDIPERAGELAALARLVDRELAFVNAALILDCGPDQINDATERRITRFADALNGWVFVCAREPAALHRRAAIKVEVGAPTTAEQRTLWTQVLGEYADIDAAAVARLADQFDLSGGAIRAAGYALTSEAAETGEADGRAAPFTRVWNACRGQARRRLDGLADRIEARATWDDIVLPDAQREMLRSIEAHVRYANTVFDDWGFADRTERGRGVSALFAGSSGTGKTLAAEVLASGLQLDLYRIDLSQVVSKYIGETEKNLSQIFDAAQSSGAILLFDEADALFGKRSDVKDSHDRYANIEVSYLLQRMEAYRGLAVLTTNLKSALDGAFIRRLRFIIQFPFPNARLRQEIWRRVLPERVPTEALDLARLAKLNVAGGHIRNIALNAAFLAAEDSAPVDMTYVLRAAKLEYGKMERPVTAAEFGGAV